MGDIAKGLAKLQKWIDTEPLQHLRRGWLNNLTGNIAIELTNQPVAVTDAVSDHLVLEYDGEGKVVAITRDNYSKNLDTVDLQAFGIALRAGFCKANILETQEEELILNI